MPVFLTPPPRWIGEPTKARLAGGPLREIAAHGAPLVTQELQAYAGRINEYSDLATASQGVLVQQHDGTSTLDLRKVHTATTITGTKSNGQNVSITVPPMESKHGWGDASYYMLERDANGDLIIEPGDYHREIWVSAAPAAMTKAMIAADAGVAETTVTGAWLINTRPDYGATQAKKVTKEVAMLIIAAMHNTVGTNDKLHPSWWMYLERGYDYTGFTYPTTQHGESPLHPRVVRAFGSGAEPTGMTYGSSGAGFPSNFVTIGVALTMPQMRGFENLLIADAKFNKDQDLYFSGDKSAGYTLYRNMHYDIWKLSPTNGTNWAAIADRISGIYYSDIRGTLILDEIFDVCGWNPNHRLDGAWNNGEFGLPPSPFNHGIYSAEGNVDMSWHGVLAMRSSSVGGQMRIGGWQMDCTSIDNQLAWQNGGCRNSDLEPNLAHQNGFLGITIRPAVISGQNLVYQNGTQGARKTGCDLQGVQAVCVDGVVLHCSDPDNPTEIAAKNNHLFRANNDNPAVGYFRGALWTNLVARRWNGDLNIDGLVTSFIDTITIQRRAATLLGQQTATIADYANYLRTLTPRQRQLEVKAVNRYLLSARAPKLELLLEDRTVPADVIFKPDWRGEGFRLDNPLNLSTKGELINGDSLDLHGNRAKWVKDSLSLEHLKTGDGLLDVNSGKVSFESAEVGSNVKVTNCGKLYVDAFDGNAVVRGGRFAVNGPSAGSIDASGQGQVSLATWAVRNGETLRICGDMGKVGWDAISAAGTLTIEAGGTLDFHATPVLQFNAATHNNWSLREEVMLGQTSGTTGFFDSWRKRHIDAYVRIRDMVGTPVVGELTVGSYFLAPATGAISAIHPATIGKITAGWRGRLGAASGATHSIVLKAGAMLKLSGGTLPAGTYDLTGPGITVTNQGATLPAGVTLTAGKLTLTV